MPLRVKECRRTRVILVRHGQSTYNALGLYQGSSDESVLTETGYKDARQTGAFLKGLVFDAVYSSSLKRAQATAREILEVIAPEVDPKMLNVTYQLREIDMLAWQGLAFQYVRETFPEEYYNWKQRPHEFRMEVRRNLTSSSMRGTGELDYPLVVGEQLGESSDQYIYPALDLYERVQKFWQEVLSRHIGQTLLLVTHGGTNRALISTALGITPEHYHCIQQSNCGISILHFSDGSLESGQLEAMNLAAHVGEYLPKLQEGGKGLSLFLIVSGTTGEQTQQLAELLKEINIDFSLNSVVSSSHMIQTILQYHPETVQLEVLRKDFPKAWQKVVTTKSTANFNQLITGVVVADIFSIKTLICQAIGMNSEQMERLQLKQGAISCIQYPGSHHPPILQAMNVSTSQKELIFESHVRSRKSEVKKADKSGF
jgi:phosphoserine phosphatase